MFGNGYPPLPIKLEENRLQRILDHYPHIRLFKNVYLVRDRTWYKNTKLLRCLFSYWHLHIMIPNAPRPSIWKYRKFIWSGTGCEWCERCLNCKKEEECRKRLGDNFGVQQSIICAQLAFDPKSDVCSVCGGHYEKISTNTFEVYSGSPRR